MAGLKLSMACWDYDRTRPLIDGRVKAEGIDLSVQVMRPRIAFERMLKTGEFDVSEMSFANYIALIGQGDTSLMAIPVMLSKMFRHNCIYIRSDAGITKPQDLKGKRIGTMRYSSTALVYARGLLAHEYGIGEEDVEWFIGGINEPLASKRPEHARTQVRINILKADQTIDRMLVNGEIDAVISQDFPDSFLNNDPRIRRLFPDFDRVEADYFRRTGIFPIMHVIAMKREIHAANPWVAGALYRAFEAAKSLALHGLHDTDALHLALPFLIRHVEEARQTFGPDFFSYGLEHNLRSVQAACDYAFEQNLCPRKVRPDELFADVGAS